MGRHSGISNETRELFEEKVAEAVAAPVAGSRVAARRAARLEVAAQENPVPAASAPVADTPSEVGMVSVLSESSLYSGSQTTKVRLPAGKRSRAAVLALAAAASGMAVLGAAPSVVGAGSSDTGVESASLDAALSSAKQSVASMTITAKVDGETRTLQTSAATIGDALKEAGIVVGEKDQVSVPLSSPVVEGAVVEIVRVATQTVTEDEVTPHGSTREEDPTLEKGTEKVGTEGVDGLVRKTYEVTLVDGKETSRTLVLETAVTNKVDEVVKVGTKEPEPKQTEAPEQQVQQQDQQAAQTQAPAAVPAGTPQQIAHSMVLANGWGEDQFSCLVTLWNRESNWNYTARNASSGAYGIPQALPGSKMASAGADWATNPATQIKWGLGYIAGRYGTPCNALGHSYSVGWY